MTKIETMHACFPNPANSLKSVRSTEFNNKVCTYSYMLNKNSLAVKSARPIRSSIANGHKQPKTLISGKPEGQEVITIKNLLT